MANALEADVLTCPAFSFTNQHNGEGPNLWTFGVIITNVLFVITAI